MGKEWKLISKSLLLRLLQVCKWSGMLQDLWKKWDFRSDRHAQPHSEMLWKLLKTMKTHLNHFERCWREAIGKARTITGRRGDGGNIWSPTTQALEVEQLMPYPTPRVWKMTHEHGTGTGTEVIVALRRWKVRALWRWRLRRKNPKRWWRVSKSRWRPLRWI